jgi:hypothetical protein
MVARHLVMVFEYLEDIPELAYRHARAAADRAGRIAVVREYAGLTSYYTQRWAEAVRELRTFQRLSGQRHHAALLADSLRGIGKPADALELAAEIPTAELDPDEAFELGIVVAGARADLGEFGAARVALERLGRGQLDFEMSRRLEHAKQRIDALAGGASPASQEFEDEAELDDELADLVEAAFHQDQQDQPESAEQQDQQDQQHQQDQLEHQDQQDQPESAEQQDQLEQQDQPDQPELT